MATASPQNKTRGRTKAAPKSDELDLDKNEEPKKEPEAPKKAEKRVVELDDYTKFFDYRKNMRIDTAQSFDITGEESFNDVIDKGLEVVNAGLRKTMIWHGYKNRETQNLVRNIFVESKEIDDELLDDAWQFGVTGRPDGNLNEFRVVAPNDPKCSHVCAVRRPKGVMGFYNFQIAAKLIPTGSKLDVSSCPRKGTVAYSYSQMGQVVVYFLPRAQLDA
jgi:hypothetical protein